MRPVINYIKNRLQYPLVGAEIGVFRGEHAVSILENLHIKKLYLVDPFVNYPDYPEEFDFDKIKPIAFKNLEKYKDKIIWILKKFDYNQIHEQLDFIYIDGNHSYEFVKHNIKIGDKLVKQGGVVGGHDYYHVGNFAGVGKAVDEWCQEKGYKLKSSNIDWWYIKNTFKEEGMEEFKKEFIELCKGNVSEACLFGLSALVLRHIDKNEEKRLEIIKDIINNITNDPQIDRLKDIINNVEKYNDSLINVLKETEMNMVKILQGKDICNNPEKLEVERQRLKIKKWWE